MKKYLVSALLWAMLFKTGSGQTILTSPLKKGLYKNFEEFVSNSPSVPFDEESFEFEEDQEELIDGITPKLFVAYGTAIKLPVFRLLDKRTKKRINTKSVLGVL